MHLVDTNILSEGTKPNSSPAVVDWLRQQTEFAVSAISLSEIEFGIARLRPGRRRDDLLKWFENTLATPGLTVFPIDVAVARAMGRLRAICEAAGRPRPSADLLIAATAQMHASTLVTRNTKDFEGLGIALLNPFPSPG